MGAEGKNEIIWSRSERSKLCPSLLRYIRHKSIHKWNVMSKFTRMAW